MSDVAAIVTAIIVAAMFIGVIIAVAATVFNNQNTVNTLEKENEKLIEIRKEYQELKKR